ncbi:hypothetical protein FOL47_003970, partial [Perkinsus chesapeaki]
VYATKRTALWKLGVRAVKLACLAFHSPVLVRDSYATVTRLAGAAQAVLTYYYPNYELNARLQVWVFFPSGSLLSMANPTFRETVRAPRVGSAPSADILL